MSYTAFQKSALDQLRKIPGTPYSVTGCRAFTRRKIREDLGPRALADLYERRRERLRMDGEIKSAFVGRDAGTVAKLLGRA